MIKKIHIENYKIFGSFSLELNDDLNIIVGDNEAGKSTVLEAIYLALTKKLNGKPIENELSPYLFNKECALKYLDAIRAGENPELPQILIELYLLDQQNLQYLKGANNSEKNDCIGIKLEIVFDEDYKAEYEKLIEDRSQIKVIPSELFKVRWYSFANNNITSASLPIGASFIDATTIRLQSGTDYYLQNIINTGLDAKERVSLSVAYRNLKEKFSNEQAIKDINSKLVQKKGAITNKGLAISIDISHKSNWETNLIPHLDELPFQLIGKGEQNALKIMLALERKADESHTILIEEPENHLSFSSMNILLNRINEKCKGKQIITTTHSAYVLNKLGIEKVILLNGNSSAFLKNLPTDTQKYFKRLSGYDTLRLILAKRSILVEGPSDELIVQKAYLLEHGKLPIEDGIDVINVRGLSFSRFLDIAKEIKKDVIVVTDNDGDYNKNIVEKYKDYNGNANIKICADKNNALNTLELHIAESNDIPLLQKVLSTKNDSKESLVQYMINNKTECALKIFETNEKIKLPDYVQNAIK